MTICELGKFYPPVHGGIETLLELMCRGFAQRDVKVQCVVANDRAKTVRENRDGVHLTRCASFGSWFSTSLCPGYVGVARRAGAKIWHTHFPNPLADLAVLRAPADAKVVITYHSDVVRQAGLMRLYGPIPRRVLRRADRIVVATPRNLEFSPWLKAHRAKARIIPFGVDVTRFEKPIALPQSIPIPSTGPILLTVGRLVGYKGHRFLIEAMKNLHATLWIVGGGPLESELRAQAASVCAGDRIRFFGDISDAELPALYQTCDIFVLPSITPNEAFGLVQLEAMACAKPVISCDLQSGVPWVNQHEVTGLVVPPADSQSLATAINRLAASPDRAKRFGEAGRIRVTTEFSEQRMIDDYLRLFEELN